MHKIQRYIYKVQIFSSTALQEISNDAQCSSTKLKLMSLSKLRHSVGQLKVAYTRSQAASFMVDENSIEKYVELNVFVFNLMSYAETLLQFEDSFNKKKFGMTYQAVSFVRRALLQHLDRQSYPRATLASSVKVTLAIAIFQPPTCLDLILQRHRPSHTSSVVISVLHFVSQQIVSLVSWLGVFCQVCSNSLYVGHHLLCGRIC